MKILHCIPSLGQGGAETALYRLIHASVKDTDHVVVTLMSESHYDGRIRSLGVPVINIGMRQGAISVSALLRLRRAIKDHKANFLMGWMYHANLAITMSSLGMRGRVPLLWNIRHSLGADKFESMLTKLVIKIGAWASRYADAVIYNSEASRQQHWKIGYSRTGSDVIHNGFDLPTLTSSSEVRRKFRESLNIHTNAYLVGSAARYHLIKGHGVLIDAMAQIAQEHQNVHLVLVGKNVDRSNVTLVEQIASHQLQDKVHLLGQCDDIHKTFYPSVDLFCSPSWSEGFPNVVAEAMSFEIPCVVTDAGESANIVGDTGAVCPVGDAAAISREIIAMANLPKEDFRILSRLARERIASRYSIGRMVRKYRQNLDGVIKQCVASQE